MKELVFLDYCHPDYFQGHSNLVLIAFPDKYTTIGETLNQIEEYANSQEIDPEFCGYSYDDLDAALKRARAEHDLDKAVLPNTDVDFDTVEDEEYPVAYFTLEEE